MSVENDHSDCEPPSEELIRVSDEKISDVIREALDERFPQHAPHMVAGWQLSAVVIANDGERYNWSVDPFEARIWETMGLVQYSKQLLNARIVKDVLEDY